MSIPEIWEGVVAKDINVDGGALTFIRIPSLASDDITGTSLIQFSFITRHFDLGQAQDYKEELIELLLGWSGNLSTDFKSVNFFMESDLGELQEDDTQIWALPVIFNVKYIR